MTDGTGSGQSPNTMVRQHTLGLALVAVVFASGCLETRHGTEREEAHDTIADTGQDDTGREDATVDTDPVDALDVPDINTVPDTWDAVDTDQTDTPPTWECPVALIEVSPGTEVAPGTVLSLDGSQSHSSDGPIVEYHWEVEQPIGSASTFRPSSFINSPRLEVNVAGTYRIRLFVRDQSGTPSCVPAEVTIFVNPSAALHIELLWRGTAPANPVDDVAGPDLDLHLAHPFAFDGADPLSGEGWFDRTFDTFWYNPTPSWGQFDPGAGDDPRLEREDTGGEGPEVITLASPEAGTSYHVGVHVWNDHGYTDVEATLRIYIRGSMAIEVSQVALNHRDLWVAAWVNWDEDTGSVELVTLCEDSAIYCRLDSDCGGGRCGRHIISPMNPAEFLGP